LTKSPFARRGEGAFFELGIEHDQQREKNMRGTLLLLFTTLLLIASDLSAANLVIDTDIDKHARVWIQPIDSGDPGTAWENSSALMKKRITKEDWEKATQPLTALGTLQSRTATTVTFSVKLQGLPDGHYAVINYSATFSDKENAVESVILRRDDDNTWRGIGYLVQ